LGGGGNGAQGEQAGGDEGEEQLFHRIGLRVVPGKSGGDVPRDRAIE
jgi:hypothetical protein